MGPPAGLASGNDLPLAVDLAVKRAGIPENRPLPIGSGNGVGDKVGPPVAVEVGGQRPVGLVQLVIDGVEAPLARGISGVFQPCQ